jgi:hypothetical protein
MLRYAPVLALTLTACLHRAPPAVALTPQRQELPSALVGGRTTNWAAYYVGFIVSTSADSR